MTMRQKSCMSKKIRHIPISRLYPQLQAMAQLKEMAQIYELMLLMA